MRGAHPPKHDPLMGTGFGKIVLQQQKGEMHVFPRRPQEQED
jgi:hypothetical protein